MKEQEVRKSVCRQEILTSTSAVGDDGAGSPSSHRTVCLSDGYMTPESPYQCLYEVLLCWVLLKMNPLTCLR